MLPSIPRPSLRALQSNSIRSFSSTPSRCNTVIPPESPRFINLAQPAQSSEKRTPRPKGHLPVPRDIFDPRDPNRKVNRDYLSKTAPLSASETAGEAPQTDFETRRREAAASRRENLTAGLRGLHARSERRRYRELKRNRERLERNRIAAVETPERADTVLTRPSVRLETSLNTKVLPDPERLERAALSAAHYAERQQQLSDNRRDALVQMYVASKEFIVDEAALREEVDKVFAEGVFSQGHDYGMSSENSVWVNGKPLGVEDMVRESEPGLSKNVHTNAAGQIATDRQRKLAELLTGGKLP